MTTGIGGVLALGLLVVAALLWRDGRRRARALARLFAGEARPEASRAAAESGRETPGRLALWLTRAGHRGARAETTFVVLCIAFAALGLATTTLLRASGIAGRTGEVFGGLPVIGSGLAVLFEGAPWLLGLAVAGLPASLVARQRTRRIARIDEDLPLVVELLATLVEAGLGFEAALAEVLRAQPERRPLAEDLRIFQLEFSAGERRRNALRRLDGRIGVESVSTFVSALIHADETGASLAATLRPEAKQARQARRERALARAEALPEKLVVPLLVGFLPSLLVWTLGPAFFQLFSMLDAAFR